MEKNRNRWLLLACLLVSIVSEAQFVKYNWNGNTFLAAATQARRYTIGRIYYNGLHWGNYGNIRLKVSSNYYKSGYLEYLIQANPVYASYDAYIKCVASNGWISASARIKLGDPVSAGSEYAGAPNYYRDIYMDADYYSQWFVEAEVTASLFAFDKFSIDYSEYSTISLFTSLTPQNIPSFNTELKTVSFPTDNANLYITSKTGVGTTTPIDNIHIRDADAGLRVEGTSRARVNLASTNYPGWQIEMSNADGNQLAGDLGFTESGVAAGRLVLKKGGNVGIGTTTPSERLSVNGNIKTKKLIVTQTNWPDYVFKSGYTLQPLQKVEQFIKENNHLPGMPSAAEIEDKGLNVGDAQALLLKKVEELTLYMIELKKENAVLRSGLHKVQEQLKTKK